MKYLRNLLLWAGVMVFAAALAAADDDAPKPSQESPEVWVPSSELNVLLSKNPRAVLLSREQYETLMREAGKIPGPIKEPPLRAMLSAAHYNGELNGDVLDVQ